MDEGRHHSVSASDAAEELSDRLDLEWIAVGKRAGLTLLEINELRVSDLADYCDAYFINEDRERKATQADIDALLR